MKLKCISERGPFFRGLKLSKGQVITADKGEADILIENGFVEKVDDKRKDDGAGRKADSKPKPRRKKSTAGQSKTS